MKLYVYGVVYLSLRHIENLYILLALRKKGIGICIKVIKISAFQNNNMYSAIHIWHGMYGVSTKRKC